MTGISYLMSNKDVMMYYCVPDVKNDNVIILKLCSFYSSDLQVQKCNYSYSKLDIWNIFACIYILFRIVFYEIICN